MKNAKLTLVGAGPGDPELISLKGIRALQKADVILYDALVHPQLLDYGPSGAKKKYVGKRAGCHSMKQEKINELIVSEALANGHVVRLKGGDPFIFGRGKEELEYAESFGIDTACIPGISSINLPGCYGIPLTRRTANESFWVITATTRNGILSDDISLVSQSSATAVILMGLNKLEQIEAAYLRAGKQYLPAAIISKGSLPDNEVHFGNAGSLSQIQKQHRPKSPALIVIGEAVGTHPYFYELIKSMDNENCT